MYRLFHKIGLPYLLNRILKPGTLTILSLHRISREKNYFWNPILPEHFDMLCAYVSRRYHVIRFDQICQFKRQKKPLIILSFDDGYYDFMEQAMPVLKKYNIPANQNLVIDCLEKNMPIWTERMNILFQYLYENNVNEAAFEFPDDKILLRELGGNWTLFYNSVYKRLLGQESPGRGNLIAAAEQKYGVRPEVKMMNWTDAASLTGNNIEIGNHSYTHEVISTLKDPADLHREIIRSKEVLETRLRIPVTIFSYPNGQVNPSLVDLFASAGYEHILEVNEKVNQIKKLSGEINTYNRITIGDEVFGKTVMRVELFQSIIKKYFR